VLTPERLARARKLSEAFDEHAHECHIEALPAVEIAAAAALHAHATGHAHAHGDGRTVAPLLHAGADAHGHPRPRRGHLQH